MPQSREIIKQYLPNLVHSDPLLEDPLSTKAMPKSPKNYGIFFSSKVVQAGNFAECKVQILAKQADQLNQNM